jgi:XTP/dITP diphosphohydrolase
MDLVVATRSAHKLGEIRQVLARVPGLRVLDLTEAGVAYDPAEEGLEPYDTFEENARSKALHFHALCGLPTVADDSGLAVEALGGAPGVRSKRFAPDTGLEGAELDLANNEHLVRRLEGVEEGRRSARYVCVAVLVRKDRPPLVCRGEAPGRILDEPRGSAGFGYDPYFFDEELGKTFAEITAREKNLRSHRGRAFGALADLLLEKP